jgi:hypothetical protein
MITKPPALLLLLSLIITGMKGQEAQSELPYREIPDPSENYTPGSVVARMVGEPISDALWHCGQVVSLRRASGNPFSSKVSVFTGKVRE